MIENRLKEIGSIVDARLLKLLDEHCEDGVLKDAILYSLTAGGKRLRPALCLMSAHLFGNEREALDIACALEMIHTYSLIHDDLPAMDNDSLRRGKPTSHIVFGEAKAILAGDGLLNLAFEVMIGSAIKNKNSLENCVYVMKIISNASGVVGMIAGQVADIDYEGKAKNEKVLEYIHKRKTAAMITASVMSGAALLGADNKEKAALREYGECIGLVFQIVDDILDVVGDETKMGKTLGKDQVSNKQTFVSLYGLAQSRRLAKEKTQQAINALSIFADKSSELKDLAAYLLGRDR